MTAPIATASTSNVISRRERASMRGSVDERGCHLEATTSDRGRCSRRGTYAGAVPSSKPSGDRTALPAVLIGTGAWLVALVVLSFQGPLAPPSDGIWWWGAAAIGVLSGVIGIPLLIRRRARMMRVDG